MKHLPMIFLIGALGVIAFVIGYNLMELFFG